MTPDALLLPVDAERRRMAAAKIAAEAPAGTLDPTALVHEAWLKLAEATGWADRRHFVRAAATAMRWGLVDRVRGDKMLKRDGGRRVDPFDPAAPLPDELVLDVDLALSKLAAAKPDHARLLELMYFAGLSGDEAASALGVSPATADRMAR